jgi:plastocyanin
MHETTMSTTAAAAAALAVAFTSVMLAAGAPAEAATKRLTGVVGPAEMITMKSGSKRLRTVRAGTYMIVVNDRSSEHNFRLTGPGVNRATSVPSTGRSTWRVKLRRGKTYRFLCDPHADSMRGSFRVR